MARVGLRHPDGTIAAGPFLKWVGGKRQLLPELFAAIDELGPFDGYHEPFVGGGALFFALRAAGRLRGRVVLSDANPELVDTWLGVRDHVEEVIALLNAHTRAHGERHYYATRKECFDTIPGRAARVIYLNKTCFNGLYRLNSKGQFNTPMGRYADPTICDEENLRACAAALAGVEILHASFEGVLACARAGDLVYFDPPYVPLSATSSFTAYAKGGFGPPEQARLAEVFAELVARGTRTLLSNSMTPEVRELYGRFGVRAVLANRAVNSKAERRGAIEEALVVGL
jgi:DNA adenine methylase